MSKTAFIVDEDGTNSEVFESVFGFAPSANARCVMPNKICRDYDDCKKCPFADWWNKPYTSCFELKEKYKENSDEDN